MAKFTRNQKIAIWVPIACAVIGVAGYYINKESSVQPQISQIANGNSSSTVNQTATINQVSTYVWANESAWSSDIKRDGELYFTDILLTSTGPILPSSICIHVESDPSLTSLEVSGNKVELFARPRLIADGKVLPSPKLGHGVICYKQLSINEKIRLFFKLYPSDKLDINVVANESYAPTVGASYKSF